MTDEPTNGGPTPDWTERRLSGTDAPRPLPTALRERLEEQLLARSSPRPLPPALRSRLEQSLPAGRAGRERSRWATPVSGIAAAVLLVAAVAGLALHGGSSNPGAVTASSGAGTTGSSRSAAAGSGAGGIASAPNQATAGGSETGSATAGSATLGAPASGSSGGAGAAAAPGSGSTSGSTAPSPQTASAAAPVPPPPSVSGLSPSMGPITGGTVVTVTGAHLGGARSVRFGSSAATFTVVSDTELRAQSPPHPMGRVDVTVVGPGGTSAVSPADRYTYVISP